MSARTSELTPRSGAAWAALCTAALPNAARKILFEARAAGGHQVDEADAWLALKEHKTEAQTRSKARRGHVQGWGTGARAGGDEADEADQIDPLSMPHGMGEWALRQDPEAAREALEIRAAVEACSTLAALEALGLTDIKQDPAAVARLHAELRRCAALAELEEADTAAVAERDRVTRRMAQIAMQEKREALKNGQGVLL